MINGIAEFEKKSINFMKDLFHEIKNGDYLEKIQVLLYLFEIIYFDKPLDYNYILDVFDKNQNKYNLYKEPSSEAFKLFFEIMDKQTEKTKVAEAEKLLQDLLDQNSLTIKEVQELSKKLQKVNSDAQKIDFQKETFDFFLSQTNKIKSKKVRRMDIIQIIRSNNIDELNDLLRDIAQENLTKMI